MAVTVTAPPKTRRVDNGIILFEPDAPVKEIRANDCKECYLNISCTGPDVRGEEASANVDGRGIDDNVIWLNANCLRGVEREGGQIPLPGFDIAPLDINITP